MRFPTLKYPHLCNALSCIVVYGTFLLLVAITWILPLIPTVVKILLSLGYLVALPVYLFREMPALVSMNFCLVFLSSFRTARTQYTLPSRCTVSEIERKISRYGLKCPPAALHPQPTDLRYKFSSPWTFFSCGIERVVVTYHTDILDADTYRSIFTSAKANSQALIHRKKALFLGPDQRRAPLHRVSVIVIFAKQVDPPLLSHLYELVCKQSGDDTEDSVLPCVVDSSTGLCIFNSLRVPFIDFPYPAKNRGLRLIRRLVLDGTYPLADNHHYLLREAPVSLEQSLWDLWKTLRIETGVANRKFAKKLKHMQDKELLFENGHFYIKWNQQGVVLAAEEDPETKTLTLEDLEFWSYPKFHFISEKTVQIIKYAIERRCKNTGWSVIYKQTPRENTVLFNLSSWKSFLSSATPTD